MEIEFKKGDKVNVVEDSLNDSFNSSIIGRSLSVYSFSDWKTKSFEIEGTIKLTGNSMYPISYLLSADRKNVGYVYAEAIKLAALKLHTTHVYENVTDNWSTFKDIITEIDNVKSINCIISNIFGVTFVDGLFVLYKGKYE